MLAEAQGVFTDQLYYLNITPPALSQFFTNKPNYLVHIERAATMISDSQLYTLAIFLGSASMLLIVLYHFLEVNSEDHVPEEKPRAASGKVKA
ncbi:hypothetical protein N0V90_006637 [Kalmusia sp. IMI 367209]|nr:hypothetical protein N0V90_006637 [Kalmusia sp. IMI 367209]